MNSTHTAAHHPRLEHWLRWSSTRQSLAIGLFVASLLPCGADWPQFLGPTRDNVYSGPKLAAQWPTEGPRKLWSRPVGQGFSGPTVLGKKVILFHRENDQDVVECFDRENGMTLWKSGTPTAYVDDFGFDEGPRATPSISDSLVFTLSAEGRMEARDLETGAVKWSVDGKTIFHARKGFFGLAPSPLVEGNWVIFNIGGESGASVVALEKQTGKVAWKLGDDEASYASPISGTFGGKRRILLLTREALLAIDATNGQQLFRYPWRPSMNASVSASTPQLIGDTLFLSASYGAGATLLKYRDSGPEKIWETEDSISSHYSTGVAYEGFIFGFDGRQEQGARLRCIEASTGKVQWTETRFGAGSLILAGSDLLILSEKGELVRAPAKPSGFKPSARAQILPFLARAHPALSDGRFLARSKDKLFCFDLLTP